MPSQSRLDEYAARGWAANIEEVRLKDLLSAILDAHFVATDATPTWSKAAIGSLRVLHQLVCAHPLFLAYASAHCGLHYTHYYCVCGSEFPLTELTVADTGFRCKLCLEMDKS